MRAALYQDRNPNYALTWWKCDKRDPYDQWEEDTRVGVALFTATAQQKKKFKRYCRRYTNRWGMFYDVIEESAPSFHPRHVRTVFKLYGNRVAGTDNASLDLELVRLFDGPNVCGGFIWLKKLHKKMKKAGLMK